MAVKKKRNAMHQMMIHKASYHCPVSALRMENDFVVVDPDICITCFCCQEICPEKAMTLR